ncbi:STAS domain-containing protein [Roseiflexus castenholzii]|jgi:anti-anti-sigma factor|uniref:Anti-sigma-factor antagonist n=1 Tax=Roseiflexus castenholzii (strain DSM 13941 / HLO8) TaxID=383372 RepID=A7NKC7_ROSCS|nr:STAS domain-containing protein [Roseiflexus castenholzii]ABU57947.1 anti-sigma-factor antagonist [Roseiflexus castenholzii DSM 13941]
MTHLFATLTNVTARNPDDQRRGRILVSLSLGVIALLLSVGMGLILLQPSVGRFGNLGLAVLVFAVAAVLGKKGFVTAGAYVLIVVSGIGALSGVFLNPNSPFNTFYLLISVLLASVLLPPRQIWVVLGICLAAVAGVLVRVPAETRTAINLDLASAHLTILLIVSAFISFIGARSLSSALKDVDESRRRAEEANRQIEVANATLEAHIEERTAAYRRLTDEQRAVVARLEESLRAQQHLNQMIADLTVPVIPVRNDTLVIPLIGSIDASRVQQLLASALQSLERTRARILIIDVTGVAVIDSHVAAALLQVAQAARLMGAETIVAGIRPEVAQTLISLGADLHSMRTAATLQSALAFTFNGGDVQ